MSKLAIFAVIIASVLLVASADRPGDKVTLSDIPQILNQVYQDMSKSVIIGIIFASVLLAALADIPADKVDLSKIPQIPSGAFNNFTTYSGNISLGANSTFRQYHYFFVTSMNNPANDPVLLWLNGGPGCSSMAGLLNENGPWVFGPNGTVLEFNPYTWNAKANVLYLETPAGVGFSLNPNNITYNDTFTAQENDRVLRVFFSEFSEFANNEFYISGESYAGVYIPSLAQTIHWNNVGGATPKINLKGMAIGNGVTYVTPLETNLTQIMFYARHNLISPQDRDTFENVCHLNYDAQACSDFATEILDEMNSAPLNPYDIYGYCWNDSQMILPTKAHYHYARFMNFLGVTNLALDDINPFAGLPPCADIVGATLFLNNKTVQNGLHLANVTWSVCSDSLNYNAGDFDNQTETYAFLLSQGYRIWYYSGDSDSVCPYDTAQAFFKNLVDTYNMPLLVAKKPWHIPGKYADEPQTTGFYEDYPNLRFMTFMGVGHMVPQWNRAGGQKMINAFLSQTNLD
eukprot:CAMPEP_0176431276 /NCGR_PEP_ID=MMETSP0127-20121128/14726_1 /TAXON_ID=938130 /ORGANISM="Platyophrya macrostoma, Strain WH" /LENGTH=515 /DNA_ID=CAMNT_0017813273 /DNA_START=22 /DNA_END=1569 /DNA_ORIENTATION=+